MPAGTAAPEADQPAQAKIRVPKMGEVVKICTRGSSKNKWIEPRKGHVSRIDPTDPVKTFYVIGVGFSEWFPAEALRPEDDPEATCPDYVWIVVPEWLSPEAKSRWL